VIENESVDLIYSHAVLEHVNDLESAYRTMYRWLRPGGFISHQIDFRSHGMTQEWNGHWAVSEMQWKIAAGKRLYLINRQPCSEHVRNIEENGFEIVYYMDKREESSIERKQLARRWKDLSDEDLRCSGAFIQARKR
jgi:SAM-dependent methyltransferase